MMVIRDKIKSVILFLLLFVGYGVFGQEVNNSLKKDNTNIYYDAVHRYFTSEKSTEEKKNILFEQNYFTQFIPKKVGDYTIVTASPYEKKLFKRIRKEKQVEMLKISPLKVMPSGKFKVSIVYFDVSNPNKKNLHFTNKGGVNVVYAYDCATNKFLFEDIE